MKRALIAILTITCLLACRNQISESTTGVLNGFKQITYLKHNQTKSIQAEKPTIGEAIVDENVQETVI